MDVLAAARDRMLVAALPAASRARASARAQARGRGFARVLRDAYGARYGYDAMTLDAVRVAAFVRAVDGAVAQGARLFFEVGPGADAVLTRGVLAHADTRIVTV